MQTLKRFLASFTLVGLLLLAHTPVVNAAYGDFTIDDFNADYTLSNAQKHGQLKVVETINLTFPVEHHGIYRAIPMSYKQHPLNLHDISVSSTTNAPTQYTTYKQNGNLVLKIGDPNRLITGAQNYTIRYTADNVIGFYPDHDELYWDINGDQWEEPFTHVKATLHLPADLTLNDNQPRCFTGGYGSTATDCTIALADGQVSAQTTQGLASSQTLTIVAGFHKGYFKPWTFADSARQYAPLALEILALPIITFMFCFIQWRKKGRDAKGTGVIIPQYDVPDNLSPIDAGTILDFKTDNKDISATIISLAIRGYIKIIETRKDHLLRKDELMYMLELVNVDRTQLTAIELQILTGLFDQFVAGEQVELKDKANDLYEVATQARNATAQNLTSTGYFAANPLSASKKIIWIALVAFFGVFLIGVRLGPILMAGLLISGAIAFLFAQIMPARTAKGVQAYEHLKGLQLFLQVTEAERLKKLQGPNAAYASSAEPVKTVELFEKLLPYAMVLGVEKEWAGQFANLYSQPPSWYGGNFNTFSTLYLMNNLNSNFNPAVNTAFASPRSSSSSGFGGGGFSGGGGGGGGGGGW